MAIDLDTLWVYRIIPIENLEFTLQNGLYAKKEEVIDPNYIAIGSKEVISRRDSAIVKCYPETVVNDYVPFYFSVRTPMLYNIHTGVGVLQYPQENIIYLCYKFKDLACDNFQWCYTNGNAASAITKFFNDSQEIDIKVDWRSITTTDFRDDNADGDEDRVRKKHAEFLVKKHVPASHLQSIVVKNDKKGKEVEGILTKLGIKIGLHINPNNQFYFL